jgi:hypothetical protein
MTKLLLISCSVAVLAGALGACSSSPFDSLAQAKLAGRNDDMCQAGDGPASGMAALNGAGAAYTQCMQERSASQPMGFSQGGRFAPGSTSSSLADIGR